MKFGIFLRMAGHNSQRIGRVSAAISTEISADSRSTYRPTYRSNIGRYVDRYIGRGVHKIHMVREYCKIHEQTYRWQSMSGLNGRRKATI